MHKPVRCAVLARRNIKETLRDPLGMIFCLGFPLVMLVIMQLILGAVEYVPENFEIKTYASGICVFGYTFTSLFAAMQIAADKNTAFMKRIEISPVRKWEYYSGHFLAALPIAVVQSVVFYFIALIFGFPFDANFILGIIYLIPSACFYICVGILVGALCKNEKQTGPVCSIFISLTGILGGVFMPTSAFTGGFATFVNALPFTHTVAIAGELHTVGASCIYPHILYILGYIVVLICAVFLTELVSARKR